MANPKIWVGAASPILGQRLESHTKTLMEGGLCPESITSFPYRGKATGRRRNVGNGPWLGWMLLCFFLRAEESKYN